VLTHASPEMVWRWPWDVIVDARQGAGTPWRPPLGDAELTIVLGPGATAGVDCDLVIETGGPDAGAVLRDGEARAERAFGRSEHPVAAPAAGLFHSERAIGERVAAGSLLGIVGLTPVYAPRAGRIRGLLRPGHAVEAGEALAELATDQSAQVSGVDRSDRIIARAVAFAIEVERQAIPIGPWRP
jgi:xanthine dehydrogenase accessory factor